MQVWNVLHAARWKYRMQKWRKKSPPGHHRATCQAESSQLRHASTIGKKLVKQHYIQFSQYGDLCATDGWYRFASFGHPCKFERVSRLGFVTAPTSLNGGQPNFARCLAVSWAGTRCIHFWGSCPVTEFCQLQNSLCVQVAFSCIGSVTARRWSIGRQPKFAAWDKEWNYGTSAEGATYIRHGGHHVYHRPTFWFDYDIMFCFSVNNIWTFVGLVAAVAKSHCPVELMVRLSVCLSVTVYSARLLMTAFVRTNSEFWLHSQLHTHWWLVNLDLVHWFFNCMT